MKREDITIVALLFLLMIALVFWQKTHYVPPVPTSTTVTPTQVTGSGVTNATVKTTTELVKTNAVVPAAVIQEAPRAEEKVVVLSNAVARITVSSWGGGITRADLFQYRARNTSDSGPVELDFRKSPALVLTGGSPFSVSNDFEVTAAPDGRTAIVRRAAKDGVQFVRTIRMTDDYRVEVTDVLTNASPVPVAFPETGIRLGAMQEVDTISAGDASLGVYSLPSIGGSDVIHWQQKGPSKADAASLVDRFQPEERRGGFGCEMFKAKLTAPLPHQVEVATNIPSDWAAVKSKYFVQILNSHGGSDGVIASARRLVPPTETATENRSWVTTPVLQEVSAGLTFRAQALEPGQAVTRTMTYFVGPTKYEVLKKLGRQQDQIMLYVWWEWFRWVCVGVIWALNGTYAVLSGLIPGQAYGVAIILLSVVTRFLFWPLTRKSTESMKKMQELQPLLAGLKEKYKGQPAKLQQETAELYKKHKVNPVAGCLPMLVQMPVFIALFMVLRGAVELRFAGFLWIGDLSQPENLLKGLLPFGLGLNILPILMTVTTYAQQKLTPSSGDPQQQKMMTLMTFFFLFLFYTMPSALVLYWTVSQALAVAEVLIQRRKATPAPAPTPA